jgi:hypothetical protein
MNHTYRVEIVNGQHLSGRVGQKLEEAMRLVADEMNAANTATSRVRVIDEMANEVVFNVERKDGEWVT